jgi:hypothetical protein
MIYNFFRDRPSIFREKYETADAPKNLNTHMAIGVEKTESRVERLLLAHKVGRFIGDVKEMLIVPK